MRMTAIIEGIDLPDVAELPKEVAKKVAALSEQEWTEADWKDLLRLQRIVRYNLAVRHKLLK